jgi:two-component system, NtrC family, sensor kinase
MSQLPISAPLQDALDKIIKLSNSDRYEAFNYCEAGFALARAAHDDAAFIAIAIQYGLVIDQHGYPDESINMLYEALQLAQSYHQFKDEARLLNVIGRAVYTRAEYRRAMQAWAHCLEVATLAGDQISWIWAKVGIAQIYHALDDHVSAVQLLQQAEEKARPLGDAALLLNVLLNLGVDLFYSQQYEQALVAYRESIAISKQLNHLDDIGETLFRIAEVELSQNNSAAALEHLAQAETICLQSHHMWALANIHGLRAAVLEKENQLEPALEQVQLGIDYAKASGSAHIEMRLFNVQSRLAEKNNDAKLTLLAFRAASQLRQQISPHDHRQQLAELEDLAGLRPSPGRLLLELANNPKLERCSLNELAKLLCEYAEQIIKNIGASYWEYLVDSQSFVQKYPTLTGNHEYFCEPLLLSLARGETTVAHNAQHHQHTWAIYERLFKPRKITSVLIVPLRISESLYGLLMIEHADKAKNWTIDEIQYMNQLATMGTRALASIDRHVFQADIARLNAQLLQNNNELEARVVDRTIELQKAMAHLIESEKLASLGNLVAGFAHELNTPLGNTLTAASTLLDKNKELVVVFNEGAVKKTMLLKYMEEASMIAELIERNARRASNLILNLKQVAVDTASGKQRKFGLKSVIDETIATLIMSLRKHQVNVINEVDDDIELNSYPGSLEQIVANLINNSLTHGLFAPGGEIKIYARKISAEWVELNYQDNGVGISDAIKKRVFDPFFTTRFGQGGSGLGLYLVYSLVNGTLGGMLELRDAPQGGVWFVLTLPVQAPEEPHAEVDLFRH